MTEIAFTTEHDTWYPVSRRRLTWARRVILIMISGGIALLTAALWWLPGIPQYLPFALLAVQLVTFIWLWILIGRRVRSFAYTERSDDLLVTSGVLIRRLVIVPYGRMQLVDVKAGPIDRWFNIASVQLHTAAATTDAVIPGLDPNIAADLRDRLAAIGEQRSAGL
jgi:membrane protein YdbS with pleckstrin-like domain